MGRRGKEGEGQVDGRREGGKVGAKEGRSGRGEGGGGEKGKGREEGEEGERRRGEVGREMACLAPSRLWSHSQHRFPAPSSRLCQI